MPYQVLALKYRPQTFAQVIGQAATIKTLQNAIERRRLHHAYLWTGPRGVGKTSLARIFAKALNCEQGPTITPCQQCVACHEITESRSLDVQEIDGASHTSVDDIRLLREHIKYTPSGGHYRIYIIDEVHMLSKSAFAALLKTLEEPPDHACFIFATTDPEKIPATILSRVLRFDLRRPSFAQLVEHLEKIAGLEQLQLEAGVLRLIARAAAGSIRDALSLLDRVVSFAGAAVTMEQASQVLGLSGRTAVFGLLESILQGESHNAIDHIQKIYEQGSDLKHFGGELLEAIHDVLMFQEVGSEFFEESDDDELERLKQLAAQSSSADIEYLFHVFYHAHQEIVRSEMPKVLLEIAVIRLCTRTKRETLTKILETVERWQAQAPQSLSVGPTAQLVPEPKRQTSLLETELPQAAPTAVRPVSPTSVEGFLKFVEQRKPSLAPVIGCAGFKGTQAGKIVFTWPANKAHRDLLQDPDRQQLLAALAQEYFQQEMAWAEEDETGQAVSQAVAAKTPDSIIDEAVSIFQPIRTETVGERQF